MSSNSTGSTKVDPEIWDSLVQKEYRLIKKFIENNKQIAFIKKPEYNHYEVAELDYGIGLERVFDLINETLQSFKRTNKTEKEVFLIAIILFHLSRLNPIIVMGYIKDENGNKTNGIIENISTDVGIEFAFSRLDMIISCPIRKHINEDTIMSLTKTFGECSINKSMVIELFLLIYNLKTQTSVKGFDVIRRDNNNGINNNNNKLEKKSEEKVVDEYVEAFIKFVNDNRKNYFDSVFTKVELHYKDDSNKMREAIINTLNSTKEKNEEIREVSRIRILAIMLFYISRIKPCTLIGYKNDKTISIYNPSIDDGITFIIKELSSLIGFDVDISDDYHELLHKTLEERSITKAVLIEMFLLVNQIKDAFGNES